MTDGAKVVFVENHGFGVRISIAKDAVFRYDEANKKDHIGRLIGVR